MSTESPQLPDGFTLRAVLARSPRGDVLHVERDGAEFVLRLSPEPREADALLAPLSLLGDQPGLALPSESGRTPQGHAWTLRPFLDGSPLDEALRGAGNARAAEWIAQLLESLAALHERSLLHRDIKADNVLVTEQGPVLLDLDLVAEHDAQAAGSPNHLAPELLIGHRHSAAADLFALGATLAYAWCGPPAEGFQRAFPGATFWEAGELDPQHVPAPFRALVRALVRRHPGDRPRSAREALSLLDAERRSPPALEIPFETGREAPLAALRAELKHHARADRELVLLALQDADEAAELAEFVALSLSLGSRDVRRPRFTGTLEAGLADELERAGESVFAADELRGRHGDAAPVELARAFAEHREELRARWWLACSRAIADEITAALEPPPPGVAVRRLEWPAVDEAGLARHLTRLTDDANPALVQGLAASLHAHTHGVRREVLAALRDAPEHGVLREDAGRWTALLDRWPEPRRAGHFLEQLVERETDPGLRRALACAAAWGTPVRFRRLCEVAEVSAAALGRALPRLLRAGLLDDTAHAGGAVAWAAGLDAVALSVFPAEEQREAHRRVLAARGPDADPRDRAAHLLFLAETAEQLDPVLAACAGLVERSRLAAARRLLQKLQAHPRASERGTALRVLEARLELAQGRSADALTLLDAGALLDDDASPEALLVGAQAAELAGGHARARELNERVLAGSDDAAERMHARAGLALGELIDGHPEAVVAATTDPPEPDADAEAACKLCDVRGLALTDLGRYPEAAEAFTHASAHARRSPSPLSVARVALNRARLDRRRARSGEAVSALRDAADAYTRAGHVRGRARALHLLGVLCGERGELTEARKHLRTALALRRRVGDASGYASGLAALGVVELESGEWSTAEETLQAARLEMQHYGVERELQLLGLYEAFVAGARAPHEARDSAETIAHDEPAPADHPGLGLRLRATLARLRGDDDDAETLARSALERAVDSGESAEIWRSAALLHTLAPRDEAACAGLRRAAEELGGDVRAAELTWRLDGPHAVADLAQRLEVFERAGLRGQTRACALALRDACEAVDDDEGRRAAAQRARQAAEALTDGAPAAERDTLLRALDRLLPAPDPEAEDSPMQLNWLLSCNRRMATEDDLEGLLLSIIDMALEVSGARRGLLLLLAGDEVDVQVAREPDHRGMNMNDVEFSRTVVREAVRSEQAIVTTDAASDARFAGTASLQAISSRAVLCVPLPGGDALSGAVYLDDDRRRVPFDDTDIARVAALADQAQVAILNLRHRAEIETLNQRLSERVSLQSDELTRARAALRKTGRVAPVGGLVGESDAMRRLYALIQRVGPTSLPVLVTGPSGAGKDLVSRALHEHSTRADGPLLIENVAAVPANLLESELFGHVRGAFTGADRDRKGLLAEADGGTFVLDEIGELPMDLQPKLLRALETGEVRPVGGRSAVKVDVRFVAATNRDLLERVRSGDFREDLYYRLNAVEVHVPPLAERPADIPLLAQHFLDRLNTEHSTEKRLAEPVLRALVQRAWPGQVRELSNEIGRLYFLSDTELDDPSLVREPARAGGSTAAPASLRLEDVERDAIERALVAADGRKDRAAQLLGISRAGLYTKLKRLDIDASNLGPRSNG